MACKLKEVIVNAITFFELKYRNIACGFMKIVVMLRKINKIAGADMMSYQLKGKQVRILYDPVTVIKEYTVAALKAIHWETGKEAVYVDL